MYDVRLGTGATDDFSNATWNRGALRTFYSSNLVEYNNPPTGQQNNNGNVYRQDHFVPLNDSVSDWVMSVDNYSYDALNRLTGVSEVADSYISGVFQETYPYAQYFNYDRYGNRTLGLATTGAASGAGATFIKDTVWVEDSLPTGATGFADGGDNWTWISSNPSPVSGSSAHQSNIAAGLHQHYFTGATATMPVSTGDKLFAYVYLDPANMPSEVMLQWNENGSWERRAYWGANLIAWGVDGTASRRNMGSLPPSGGWMRLEVPASLVGLEGKTVTGMAFTLYGGRATWDRAGKSAQPGGSINNRPFNVDASRNRLLAVSGTMQYDAAGNLNYDNYTTPTLGQRNYDAENKMTAVYNTSAVLQHSYYYDGDGQRARRIINGVETWQIYGISGELVAEYAAGGATNAPQKEYGYRGGQLLIVAESNGAVKWLVGDQLGTPRMVVDKSGALGGANGIVRHDYLPFGEEISAGVGIRSSSYGYGTDTVRQKYTGYEHDGETGLDFAQARYFASVQGRFTSPDPLLASGRPDDPRSWNRYAYTRNNPLRFIDPTGLYDWDESAGGIFSDDELLARQEDKTLTKAERKTAKEALQFRARFRRALAAAAQAAMSGELDSRQRAAVQESVDAYGTEGDINGVFVGVRPDGKGSKGTALLNEDDTTTVMFNRGLKGDDLIVTLAHEGRHAADITNWLGSHSATSVYNINHYYREWRAWDVSSFVGQALGMKSVNAGSKDYEVWNKGWKAADREILRNQGAQAILGIMSLHWSDTNIYSNEHKHRP